MEFVLKFEIQMLTGFQIQSGYGHKQFHQVVVRNPQGQLFLPASSLKGRLRYYSRLFDGIMAQTNKEDYRDGPFEDSSIIKKMFGSEKQSGCLFFDAGRLKPEFLTNADSPQSRFRYSEARSGTQLLRSLGSVRGKSLRFYEVGPRGLEFSTQVEGTLTANEPWETSHTLNVLLGALKLFNQLGADKSRGNGSVRIFNQSLSVRTAGKPYKIIEPNEFQTNLIQYIQNRQGDS